jgi:hypothetical protein
MVDFSCGGKLLFIEKDFNPSVIMGLRIAYAYFLQGKHEVSYPEFLQFCSVSVESFTIASVMEAISKDLKLMYSQQLFIVLHIDEVQFIFDFEYQFRETNFKFNSLFKLLM